MTDAGDRPGPSRLGFAQNLLRPASGDESSHVTYTELFFDLVFVFAVTQTSHILIHHQSVETLLHCLLITVMVWWVWVYTTWASSWLNPERGWVRALFLVLMVLGMLTASGIPDAFTSSAVLFAASMTALNLTRSVFTIFAFARHRPDSAVNFVRISLWHAFAGALWMWGAFAGEDVRPFIWLAAFVIDLAGPRLRFVVPGLGRSSVSTWNVSGEHMAERVSTFFIIALGESIVVTGATFSAGEISWTKAAAFLAAFAGTVLMWLLYFNRAERGGSAYISQASERGMIAQVAYTYIPALMVIGIVLSAVADKLVLDDPLGVSGSWTTGLLCGSFALYLLGNAFFKRAIGGPWLLGHVLGIPALAILAALSPVLSGLAISWIANAVLAAAVLTDGVTWRRAIPQGQD